MPQLTELRESLTLLTVEILNLIDQRKKLVREIQESKSQSASTENARISLLDFMNFDATQELLIFKRLYPTLKRFSLKELMIVSLMIEEHASTFPNSYPAWSESIHLEKTNKIKNNKDTKGLEEQINPILLAVTHKSLYDSLVLNKEFTELINSTYK